MHRTGGVREQELHKDTPEASLRVVRVPEEERNPPVLDRKPGIQNTAYITDEGPQVRHPSVCGIPCLKIR